MKDVKPFATIFSVTLSVVLGARYLIKKNTEKGKRSL